MPPTLIKVARHRASILVWPIAFLSLLLAGCGGSSGSSGDKKKSSDDDRVDVEYAMLDAGDVIASPEGGGSIIARQLFIDFADDLSLGEIDRILEAIDLERVGFIGGVNQVTARITDARTELEARALTEAINGVDNVVLNRTLKVESLAGSIRPVLDSRVSNPDAPIPFEFSSEEFKRNWPHYLMDTMPGLALADAVLADRPINDVALAVLDPSGFQYPNTDSEDAVFRPRLSLLSSRTRDTDLASKVIAPTGIELIIEPSNTTRSVKLTTGPVSPDSNHLVGFNSFDRVLLHGLGVSSVALGSGQDILGTSKHARFRPIRTSILGVCSADASFTCGTDIHCAFEGAGTCVLPNEPTISTDWFAATLAEVANNPNIDGDDITRVLSMSFGYGQTLTLTQVQIDKFVAMLRPHMERFISGNRIIVVSAGNEFGQTVNRVMPSMASARTTNRFAPGASFLDRGLMIVASSSFARSGGPGNVFWDGSEREGHSAFSNTGPNVTVAAPGQDVPVLSYDLEDVSPASGTSYSAPYVAGLAAEMFALDSSVINVEVIDIIERTADDLGPAGDDDLFGHGRVNVWKAILTLLNRGEPADEPAWLGVRYRSAVALPADQFRLDGDLLPTTRVNQKHVLNIEQDLGDNAREVPFIEGAAVEDAQFTNQFSFSTDVFETADGGIVLLEVVRENGDAVYQTPVRMSDLLSTRPLDTTLDDFVVTFDVQEVVSTIYGVVLDQRTLTPLAGATLTYTDFNGARSTTTTDAKGGYTIYDAMPDSDFDLEAASPIPELVGAAEPINTNAFQATRLNFILGLPPAETTPSSTFSSSDDSWFVGPRASDFGNITGGGSPIYNGTGGNPGGYISWIQLGPGTFYYFGAPSKFRGDHSAAFRKQLTFDLRQSSTTLENPLAAPFVVLSNAVKFIYIFTDTNPGSTWTSFSIPLDTSLNWRVATTWGASSTATDDDIRDVLSTLTDLRIRGEYGFGPDTGQLDNVILGAD